MKITFNQHIPRKSVFDYKRLGGTCLHVRSNMVMRAFGEGIQISFDNGNTWTKSFTVPVGEFAHSGHILSANNIVFFTGTGRLFRSTDGGTTFTEVNMSAFGTIIPPLYHGIDSGNANVVTFAEYPTGSYTGNVRVFRSTDAGLTWNVILTKNNPNDIIHFHTVHYDELTPSWIVTSGDPDDKIHWYQTKDGGATWTTLVGTGSAFPADQRHRTVNMFFPEKGKVLWASDSGLNQQYNALYRASLDSMGTVERVFDFINVCYGVGVSGNVMVVPTNFEGGAKDRHGYIYVSTDGGKTFNIDMKWRLIDGKDRGGFFSIHGPSADGSFFCNHGSAELYGTNGTDNRCTKMTLV